MSLQQRNKRATAWLKEVLQTWCEENKKATIWTTYTSFTGYPQEMTQEMTRECLLLQTDNKNNIWIRLTDISAIKDES
jgi:hypothetical protein